MRHGRLLAPSRLLPLVVAAALLIAVVPATAVAQTEVGQAAEDSASGVFTSGGGTFDFSATAGPSGENPTGTVSITNWAPSFNTPGNFQGRVTCLEIWHNTIFDRDTAFIVAERISGTGFFAQESAQYVGFGVTDMGVGNDLGGGSIYLGTFPFCGQRLSSGERTVDSGEILVHDGSAPPPDADADADGVPDSTDDCPAVANPAQENNDSDGQGDACDPDDDNDGVADGSDNCQFTSNPGQENNDGDVHGDACDADDDNDGTPDTADVFPLNPAESTDTDADGVGDNGDNCPSTANTDQADRDGDGLGNACDPETAAEFKARQKREMEACKALPVPQRQECERRVKDEKKAFDKK